MPAVVVSTTDQVESVKSALGAKGNVTVNDDAGNEVAHIAKKVEDTDQENTDKDNQDLAASDAKDADDKTAADSADAGEDKEDDKPKPDKKVQKRIDGLIKEVSDLKSRLEAQPQPKDAKDQKDDDKAQPQETAEPTPDDYDTQAEYMKALSKWAAKEARKEQKAEDAKQAAITAQNQTVDNWKKQVEVAKAKYPNWDDVMDDTVIGNAAARMLVETADGAELAYYIATHKEEAKQFATLTSEREVAMALGSIRAALKVPAKGDEASKDTNAKKDAKPKPITPLSGGSGGNVEKDPSKMDYKSYKRYREQQLNQRRA